VYYTNAATIVAEDFRDTEELEGVFSGLMEYTGGTEAWPFNGFVGMYDSSSWQYARTEAPPEPRGRIEHPSGHPDQHDSVKSVPQGPPFEPLIRSLRKPPPLRDETLQDPRTVFQLLKRHFSRYTVDMVEQVTGCPREIFLNVAETILANSGRERTTAWTYAVGWTQHTYGPQMIGCCALLQLLLGNIGRPGGGIMALRGHASIQGSTDIPTLYHSIHGYMPAPSASKNTPPWLTIWWLRRSPPATGPTCRPFWYRISSPCMALLPLLITISVTPGTRRSLAITPTCPCSWP